MNNYTGKICPFCKTELTETDEVVVCSNCDMPHHKECWIENQGCTTFGCLGTIKAADNGVSSVTATELQYEEPAAGIFCSKCGARHSASSTFCSYCGAALRAPAAPVPPAAPVYTPPAAPVPPVYTPPAAPAYTPPPSYNQGYQQQNYNQGYQQPNYNQGYQQPNYNQGYQQQGYNQGYQQQGYAAYGQPAVDPEMMALLGSNQEYYLKQFAALRRPGANASWNWAAFLVTPAWFLYRKMYGIGIGLLCASVLFELINLPVLNFLLLAGEIALSLFANKIYMNKLEPLARQAKNLTEPYKTEFINKNGKTGWVAIVIAFACVFVLNLLLNL